MAAPDWRRVLKRPAKWFHNLAYPDDKPSVADAQLADEARSIREMDAAADRTSAAAYEEAVYSLAKGALERSQARAEFVQKAAAAILGLYTGALTLAFSVTENPLPARGFMPVFFLAIAIWGASFYLAILTRDEPVHMPYPAHAYPQAQRNRTVQFVAWTRAGAQVRAWALRCAVIALGIGVVYLPAPFLESPAIQSVASTACATQEKAPATGACLPAWPTPPPGRPDDVALRQKLYEAQLAEAAAARTAANTPQLEPDDDTSLVVGFGLAGLIVIVVIGVWGAIAEHMERERKERERRERERKAHLQAAVAPPRLPQQAVEGTD